jgi:hypothetical protein
MLFNERYMSVPIANVLYVAYKQDVHSEFLHPILAPEMKGRGRRPEVDFAVVEDYPKLSCVLESKWLGPNGLSAEELLWDLLRLELIAHHTRADAFFLLAGKRRNIERFFKSKAFLGKEKNGKYRRLLKLDARRNARIRVDNPPKDRIEVFRKLFRPYQNVSFSSRITTSICHFYPKDCPTFQYQAYVWKVIKPSNTPRFKPSGHVLYRVEPNVSD